MMPYTRGQNMCMKKNIHGTLYCKRMTRFPMHLLFIILLYCFLNFNCNSQDINRHTEKEKLTLTAKIIMPEVRGRIDHISYDPVNHLAFIAALGNNTVEVININTKQIVHTITDLREPQGIVYIPSLKKLVVAN